jgi:F-type H+-transporting ATPase subunit c
MVFSRVEYGFMKNGFVGVATALGGVLLSSMAFAEESATAAANGNNNGMVAIGAGLAIGLGAFGAATAQGRTASAALEGLARNPAAKDVLFQPFILGLVFMELQALLAFVIAIIWTFK